MLHYVENSTIKAEDLSDVQDVTKKKYRKWSYKHPLSNKCLVSNKHPPLGVKFILDAPLF